MNNRQELNLSPQERVNYTKNKQFEYLMTGIINYFFLRVR